MRLLIVVSLLFVITACGWQLRGVMPLPAELQVLHLNSKASHSFNQQLRLQLEFNNVLLVSQADDAPTQLWIDEFAIERRALAIASNGRVSEYELNGRLSGRILRPDTDQEIDLFLPARRTYRNDVDNVVGTANEERVQRQALEQDLIGKLMRRLQAVQFGQVDNSLATP